VKCIIEEEREYIFYNEQIDLQAVAGRASESDPPHSKSSGEAEEEPMVKVEEEP
jgi:hypothetical protein